MTETPRTTARPCCATPPRSPPRGTPGCSTLDVQIPDHDRVPSWFADSRESHELASVPVETVVTDRVWIFGNDNYRQDGLR